MNSDTFSFNAIGVVHSPYAEKFGIPRQSGLVPEAVSTIELYSPYNRPEAVRDLEQFSHVWVISVFHQSLREQWKPTVRPPRLGGNDRIGVFASRSPFRPNAIGLSSARLLDIDSSNNQVTVKLAGLDLVNGTPVLDIKPYVTYTDALADADSGYAEAVPARMQVRWQERALQSAKLHEKNHKGFITLVEQVLAQDPRPAYQEQDREYGLQLFDINIRWRANDTTVEVLTIKPVR